jgi:phosphoglucomutase
VGLLPANHYLAAMAVSFSTAHSGEPTVRSARAVVSSSIIDRVATGLGPKLYEVPMEENFKYFVEGLLSGSKRLCRRKRRRVVLQQDGSVWTTVGMG